METDSWDRKQLGQQTSESLEDSINELGKSVLSLEIELVHALSGVTRQMAIANIIKLAHQTDLTLDQARETLADLNMMMNL